MKIRNIGWSVLVLLAAFAVFGCKSTPEETPLTETPGTETPASETPAAGQTAVDLSALNAAAERAAAARKFVSDFDAPSLLPQDWQAAESLYTQAEQQKKTASIQEAAESAARYTAAAAAFEAMRDKTLTAYYENKEKQLAAARNAVISARAEALVPDYLLKADNVVLDARQKYQAKDYYGAKAGAEQALSMYAAGKSGLDAYHVRETITARGFEKYDPQNVKLGDDNLNAAAADYSADNFVPAKEKADAALLRYNQALGKGWETYAGEKRGAAASGRQKALDNKANVAVRQDFNSAQDVYNRANTAFQRRSWDEAGQLYEECQTSFEAAALAAQEKRQTAERALERANEKMTESDETARSAELILEGGVQ